MKTLFALFTAALLINTSCTRCRQCVTIDIATRAEVKSERKCESRYERRSENRSEVKADGNGPFVPGGSAGYEIICTDL